MKTSISKDRINHLIKNSVVNVRTEHDKVTIVSLKLPNGFVITESSSCVDPDNYNLTIGKNAAMERIITRLWELEGYLLQQRLHDDKLRKIGEEPKIAGENLKQFDALCECPDGKLRRPTICPDEEDPSPVSTKARLDTAFHLLSDFGKRLRTVEDRLADVDHRRW